MKSRVRNLALASGIIAALLLQSCGTKKEEQETAVDKPEASGQPKITALESNFNFGKVKQGENVEHIFKIKNEGKADLKIEKARGS